MAHILCGLLERKCCKVRVRAAYLSLAIMGAILISAMGVQAKPAQEGAFLTEYAGSVDSIIQQVEANRLVALRYAKHFKMDPASVLIYFRNELSPATLNDSASMSVYFIGDSSRIESDTQAFKKGTKVFVDSQGVPILEYGTGNPLGSSLEPAKPEGVQNASSPQAGQETGNNVAQTVQPPQTQQPLSAPTPDGTQPLIPSTTDATSPVITPTVNSTVTASAPTGDTGPILPKIGHSRSSDWMVPAGLAGAIAMLAGGSGVSRSSSNPGDGKTDGGGNLPVVPEPVSIMMMTSGLAALAGGVAWRKRRAK